MQLEEDAEAVRHYCVIVWPRRAWCRIHRVLLLHVHYILLQFASAHEERKKDRGSGGYHKDLGEIRML